MNKQVNTPEYRLVESFERLFGSRNKTMEAIGLTGSAARHWLSREGLQIPEQHVDAMLIAAREEIRLRRAETNKLEDWVHQQTNARRAELMARHAELMARHDEEEPA